MAKAKQRKQRSIFRAIFVPIIVLTTVQIVSFYIIAGYGSTKRSLEKNAVGSVEDSTLVEKGSLQALFDGKWLDFPMSREQAVESYTRIVEKYGDKPFSKGNTAASDEYLREMSESLMLSLRKTNVNGIFIILNDKAERQTGFESQKKTGICIRDYSSKDDVNDTQDAFVVRAPESLKLTIEAEPDQNIESAFTFENEQSGDFFYKPITAAYEHKGATSQQLGYLSYLHSYTPDGRKVLSYSFPLLDNNGYPFAVMGVELTKDKLEECIPDPLTGSGEISICYSIAMKSGEDTYRLIASKGDLYDRVADENGEFRTEKCEHGYSDNGFDISLRNSELTGIRLAMDNYNKDGFYTDSEICIVSLVRSDDLFAGSNAIRNSLLALSIFALLFTLTGLLVISKNFAEPITDLAASVKQMTPTDNIKLERLGITEIDELVDNIEQLSHDVSTNMAKTEFFSRMSHDMRTPMNAIISFSSPELLEGVSEQQKDMYFEKINSAGQYLLGIINELLDMNKLEGASTTITLSPHKALTLFDTVADIAKRLAAGVKVNFSTNISAPDDLVVSVDKQHLEQVVMNLLSNAVKYTPAKGTVCLNAEFVGRADGSVRAAIDVKDTGVGMSSEFIEKMYEPFVQGSSDNPGTGLGLPIAKGLIELMGGRISCTSIVNVGTTFHIVIDLDRAELTEQADESTNEKSLEILRGRNVLLCEDHPINAQIAKALLEKKGMRVDVAENGRIGVEMFRQSDPDEFAAILMDIRMPQLNGLDAAREIRALDRPDASTVPIIAMTANAFAEDIQEALDAGMDSHTAKPVDPKELYAELAGLIAKNEKRREL